MECRVNWEHFPRKANGSGAWTAQQLLLLVSNFPSGSAAAVVYKAPSGPANVRGDLVSPPCWCHPHCPLSQPCKAVNTEGWKRGTQPRLQEVVNKLSSSLTRAYTQTHTSSATHYHAQLDTVFPTCAHPLTPGHTHSLACVPPAAQTPDFTPAHIPTTHPFNRKLIPRRTDVCTDVQAEHGTWFLSAHRHSHKSSYPRSHPPSPKTHTNSEMHTYSHTCIHLHSPGATEGMEDASGKHWV